MPRRTRSISTFVYILVDPRAIWKCRYVGVTSNPYSRLASHLHAARYTCKPNHRLNWIRSLSLEGVVPEMHVIEEIAATDHILISERERFWIRSFRESGHILTNSTDGGEIGAKPDAQVRKRMSEARTKHVNTAVGRQQILDMGVKSRSSEAISKRVRGYKEWWYQLKHSDPERYQKLCVQRRDNTRGLKIGRSKFYGVSTYSGPSLKKWRARVFVTNPLGGRGREHHIGLFMTEQEAADAVRAYCNLHHLPYCESKDA